MTIEDRPDLTEEENAKRRDAFSRITGDFDDELEDITTPSVLGALSSGNGNGNGNGNGGGDGKKKPPHAQKGSEKEKGKGKEKIEIPIYKYTANFKMPLHEAILLAGQPFFIAYDPQKKFIGCINNIEEAKRILRPPDSSEYPYEPIEFESLTELKKYTELALEQNPDSLYQMARAMVLLYIDQEPEIITLTSADIIWTWFQDLFATTHYYDVNGKANGIGKSTIGHVFEAIAYRPARMTDPSSPNLFRVLGQIEPGQCTIIADEADRMHQDKDALSILKEGYQIRARVPKTNPNSFKQEWFHCYCFKIRIAEESLRANITRGVIDRSFQIKAIKGQPQHDIKEVLNPSSRIPRLKQLRDDLNHFRKLMLCYRLIHHNDQQPDIDIYGLAGREKELCKPLLQSFYGRQAYGEVYDTIMTFLERKNKHKKSTAIDPVLFEIVLRLIKSGGLTLRVSRIWEEITNTIPGVYDSKKANDYLTYDYDTIYRNTITKTIEGFGAEHDKVNNQRVLVFDMKKLEKTCKQYDIDIGAVRAVQPYGPKKDQNNTTNNPPSEGTPEISEGNGENKGVYGSTASTASTAISSYSPDPELAKTSEYLKNH